MQDQFAPYWYSRLILERGLALIYLTAFIVVVNQFIPLLGERGLLPVPRFIQSVPFLESPSLFYLRATDGVFRVAGWLGVLLSIIALTGIVQHRNALAAGALWGLLWILYLSFVNVGQTFYSFGWESLLLEVGFFTIFAGAGTTAPPMILNWIYRWTLFRLMFGAGLIKLRGDSCWRDLTCLDYYFETQPIPNPLSWYFHWLPRPVLHGGVAFNHLAELIIPFGYFLPQPFAGIAGLVTIVFQLTLIVSGNLSWLNWLTIVLAFATLDNRFLAWLPISLPAVQPLPQVQRIAVYALGVLVAYLSIAPTMNMLSPNQVMNTSFNPLQIVNTYGAFGSITRDRYEIAIEGTADESIESATWREYQFKGKPGDPSRRPSQIAPYHLRLDWLMWFAAMGNARDYEWFPPLMLKLLEGDAATIGLLGENPFPDRPPRWVRARMYKYTFTTAEERRQTGRFWNREVAGDYFPAVRLNRSNQ